MLKKVSKSKGKNMEHEKSELMPPASGKLEIKGEMITMREITLEDLQVIAEQLMIVVTKVPADMWSKDSVNPMFFVKAIINKELFNAIKIIVAQTTSKSPEWVGQRNAKDLLKIAKEFFKVNNFGEVKELFLDIMKDLGISLGKAKELLNVNESVTPEAQTH